jgi:hypothetical protein
MEPLTSSEGICIFDSLLQTLFFFFFFFILQRCFVIKIAHFQNEHTPVCVSGGQSLSKGNTFIFVS